MITKTDLSSINLSPTKKDFYQIWNELLDTAKKISEIYQPIKGVPILKCEKSYNCLDMSVIK